jgi:hypothetical protein
MEKEAHGVSPEGFPYRSQNFPVSPSIGQKKTPAVCPCDRKAETPPLFNRSIETEKVFSLLTHGESFFPAGSVEVDDPDLIFGHQQIFKLEISVIETFLMKLPEEKTCGLDRFPFMEEVFM